ncbi:hypothetical protein SeLEV6574_g00576 [Synchytrium endobioticum]|uniref:Uncharacterized protein n=1 Tax=Synchytrium endobioticum TaxID=286115 RepID=A0A507DIB1_9FUNG|nr:hypothetical protein SeLEV6574_g00576 [Synchytrium endobioticum]
MLAQLLAALVCAAVAAGAPAPAPAPNTTGDIPMHVFGHTPKSDVSFRLPTHCTCTSTPHGDTNDIYHIDVLAPSVVVLNSAVTCDCAPVLPDDKMIKTYKTPAHSGHGSVPFEVYEVGVSAPKTTLSIPYPTTCECTTVAPHYPGGSNNTTYAAVTSEQGFQGAFPTTCVCVPRPIAKSGSSFQIEG